mmetsp:Transcript_39592/g.82258  ORF Transcript_39592/g.82258 Transcript_39592/m.82258 type:complete len:626 (-) Transcript_39592:95-1972(-)
MNNTHHPGDMTASAAVTGVSSSPSSPSLNMALDTASPPENNALSSDEPERPSWFIIQVTAIAGLGGILFGYDLGVISGALPYVAKEFDLSDDQKEWVVSILYVGALLGAIFGGAMCDALGRKRSILITDVLFVIGALILFVAPNYAVLLYGRIVVGFAVAVSGIADVSYLHEIAPSKWRGSIVSVNEACISLGFLLAFAVSSILSFSGDSGAWRIMFGLSGLVAMVQFFGMLGMPESPKWLQECGRHEESLAAMARIQSSHGQESTETTRLAMSTTASSAEHPRVSVSGTQTQQQTYDALPPSSGAGSPDEVGEDLGTNSAIYSTTSSPVMVPITGWDSRILYYMQQVYLLWRQALAFVSTTMNSYPRQGWITVFLSVTQQLCGQTNILSFAPFILASLVNSGDNSDDDASSYVKGWTTVSIGLVKFLVTVLVIWKIDQIGRRPLLLCGMSAIAAGLVLLTVAGASIKDPSDDNNVNTTNVKKDNGFQAAMGGILLVVCGYSMSFGPLTWLLTSEQFPTDIRGRALGASTILSVGSAIFVTSTFLSMKSWMGNTAVFGFYLLVTMLGTMFAVMAVPETKGKTVAEIDVSLDRMMWWRRDRLLVPSGPANTEFSLHETPASGHELT